MADNQTEVENMRYGGANSTVAKEGLANLAAAVVSDLKRQTPT